MEETIDLKEYFEIIKKKFWIIALTTIVAMVVSGVYSFFLVTPVYQASTTVMINNRANVEGQVTTGDIQLSSTLASTYTPVIKSRKVGEQIVNNLGLNMAPQAISGMISMSPVSEDSPVMRISVTSVDPAMAQKIANEVPNVFSKELRRIAKIDGVEVIDEAILPMYPSNSNGMMNIVIAAVLGVMIGLFVIFLLEYLDNRLKGPKDIERHLGLPVLGQIPMDDTNK